MVEVLEIKLFLQFVILCSGMILVGLLFSEFFDKRREKKERLKKSMHWTPEEVDEIIKQNKRFIEYSSLDKAFNGPGKIVQIIEKDRDILSYFEEANKKLDKIVKIIEKDKELELEKMRLPSKNEVLSHLEKALYKLDKIVNIVDDDKVRAENRIAAIEENRLSKTSKMQVEEQKSKAEVEELKRECCPTEIKERYGVDVLPAPKKSDI